MATVKPKVKAICGTDGEYSEPPVQLPTPMTTKKKVPINSANNWRQIFLLSVMSLTPTMADISEMKKIL